MKSHQKNAAYRCATVILSAILVIASLSMTGCSSCQSLIPNRDPQPDDTTIIQPENTDQNNSQEPKPEDEPKEDKPVLPSYYNPLTGLASETDLSLVRPVAICIGNTASALSPFGLHTAEIVIEAPVEGGATKLTILTSTYTHAAQLGAVGVTRRYLQSFAAAFGAVNVCAGTSDILQSAGSSPFPAIDYAEGGLSTVFFRNEEIPDALFTSGTRLIGALENFEKFGAKLPFSFLPYGTAAAVSDQTATGVVIPYSDTHVTQFAYDKDGQRYICSQNAAMQANGTNEALAFTNLLLLTCESSIHHKTTGTEFELNTENGGTGYYVSQGSYIEISWSIDENGALQITDKDGATIVCNRGNTYIGLIDLAESSSLLIIK